MPVSHGALYIRHSNGKWYLLPSAVHQAGVSALLQGRSTDKSKTVVIPYADRAWFELLSDAYELHLFPNAAEKHHVKRVRDGVTWAVVQVTHAWCFERHAALEEEEQLWKFYNEQQTCELEHARVSCKKSVMLCDTWEVTLADQMQQNVRTGTKRRVEHVDMMDGVAPTHVHNGQDSFAKYEQEMKTQSVGVPLTGGTVMSSTSSPATSTSAASTTTSAPSGSRMYIVPPKGPPDNNVPSGDADASMSSTCAALGCAAAAGNMLVGVIRCIHVWQETNSVKKVAVEFSTSVGLPLVVLMIDGAQYQWLFMTPAAFAATNIVLSFAVSVCQGAYGIWKFVAGQWTGRKLLEHATEIVVSLGATVGIFFLGLYVAGSMGLLVTMAGVFLGVVAVGLLFYLWKKHNRINVLSHQLGVSRFDTLERVRLHTRRMCVDHPVSREGLLDLRDDVFRARGHRPPTRPAHEAA